jgi:hypothetical protein
MADPVTAGAVAAGAASNVSGAPYGKSDSTFAAWLDKAYPNETIPATSGKAKLAGSTLGAQYKTFAGEYEAEIKAQYPSNYLAETQGAFMILVGETTLAKGTAKAASETANETETAAKGAAEGIGEFASSLDFLDALGSPALWIRVAKVVVGGVILIVGLVKLAGVEQKVPGIVKTAVKAAPLL